MRQTADPVAGAVDRGLDGKTKGTEWNAAQSCTDLNGDGANADPDQRPEGAVSNMTDA